MFKSITKVLQKKPQISDEEINKISEFVFLRWAMGHPATIQMANIFNYYYHVKFVHVYYAFNKTFGGKINFIKYPKSVKKQSDNSKDIELLAKHFNINLKHAGEYYSEIMEYNPEELEQIRALYRTGVQ